MTSISTSSNVFNVLHVVVTHGGETDIEKTDSGKIGETERVQHTSNEILVHTHVDKQFPNLDPLLIDDDTILNFKQVLIGVKW